MLSGLGKACAALALCLGLCLWGGGAAAQVPDPQARDLARQLAQAESFLSERGYARAAGPFAGGLGSGETRRFTVTLRAGLDYHIVGVCDALCGDLDLALYDGPALIREDAAANRTPAVDLRPRATGPHEIEVRMHNCPRAACYFAFNVYAR